MTVKTEDCKNAIVSLVNASNGAQILAETYNGSPDINEFLKHVYLYDPKTLKTVENPTIKDVLHYAGNAKFWKRECKEKVSPRDWGFGTPQGSTTCRIFVCRPFEDQLRAYVYDDGNQILKVSIQGE